MSVHDRTYHTLLRTILDDGDVRPDRTGVGTIGVFGTQSRYDLRAGFPLLTTKRIHVKSVVGELLWILRGDTNTRWLTDRGITIWKEWADEHGDLGPVYGAQWRDFGGQTAMPEDLILIRWDAERFDYMPVIRGVDQIAQLIEGLRRDPFSRRHIVTAWNPLAVPDQALPPCHSFVQFHVSSDESGLPVRLNCQLYQRSGDVFLGCPFNIASYSLLTHIIAAEVGLAPGTFVHTIGDAHIYLNHLDQVREQLSRTTDRLAPTLVLDRGVDRDPDSPTSPLPDYEIGDVTFVGYDPMPTIKAPVAV